MIRAVLDADQIVSGDLHFWNLREHIGISIVTARTFLDILNGDLRPVRA